MFVGSQFVLVSAFGRGNWLAVELVKRGCKVVLVDVSERLGNWAPEDWEGPFGVFISDRLSLLQKERLVADEIISQQEGGLTFWLEDRSIELTGPIAKYQLDKQGVSQDTRNYIFDNDSSHISDKKSVQRKIQKRTFSENWMAHFAHQWSANRLAEYNLGFVSSKPLPLFSKFNLRQATRRGYQQSLDWCESNGVQVYRNANIEDFVYNKKKVEGIEVSSNQSGLLKAQKFIWCLSSEETMRFKERVWRSLFPQGSLQPQWVWMRYRVRFIKGQGHLVLPRHVVMIRDLFLPWTHENLAVVQKTVADDEVDVWSRVPNTQRMHVSYIRRLGQKILLELRKRMPGSDVEVASYPQEEKYTYETLGPSRFPIYDEKELGALKKNLFSNLHYDGPECWDRLDWEGIFEYQTSILNEVKIENDHGSCADEELMK